MDRSFNPIDTVCLESFPWADLSIFQDEEMDARGIDLEALGTLPVDVDFRMSSGYETSVEGNALTEKYLMENTPSADTAVKKKIVKKPRGPKPKYIFSNPEQAAAARKERNRAAALQSYYKKKNHTLNLEAQVRELEEEQNKLTMLLEQVENGHVTIQSEGDIDQHISGKQ